MIHRRNQNAEKLAVILTLCNEFGDPKTESFGGGGHWFWIHIRVMVVFDLCHVQTLGTAGYPSVLMKQLDRFRRRLTSESMSGQSAILTTSNRGFAFSACLLWGIMTAKGNSYDNACAEGKLLSFTEDGMRARIALCQP